MRIWFGAVLLLLDLLASATSARGAAAQTVPTALPDTDPQQVVNTFELARGAGDVDAAIAQFTDNAIVVVQSRTATTYNGKDQVRAYLQSVGTHFQTIMRSRAFVEANRVTWTERDQYGDQTFDATVVAIVSAGRIVSLTYRDNDPFSSPTRAAPNQQQQNLAIPSYAWPAALALVGIGLIGLVFGLPRRKASQSRLDGRLMLALRHGRDVDNRLDRAA